MGHKANLHRIGLLALTLLLGLVSCELDLVNQSIGDDNSFQKGLPGKLFEMNGDAVAQACVMVVIGITLIDYFVTFILLVHIMLFVAMEANTLTQKTFSIFITLIFTLLRLLFFPLILSSIPYSWSPKLPEPLLKVSFYLCLSTYVLLFNAPLIASLYHSLKFGVRAKKLSGGIVAKATGSVPNVVIMMPIYNEELEALLRAIQSAVRCDYPAEKKHLLLAFDDAVESKLYFGLLNKLGILNEDLKDMYKEEANSFKLMNGGLEPDIFPPRLELMVEKVRVTICRFDHEGKSATQGKGYRIIKEIYGKPQQLNESTLLMYIDSDVILHRNALHNFVVTILQAPRLKAITGYITCRTSENFNFYQYLQDAEYLDGQYFSRNLESLGGSVTCLPGALTVIKLTAMQEIEDKYFIDFNKEAPLHFHRYYLGEDRFMTHLLMEQSDRAHTIGLCGASWCKTDAPDTWDKLIKQRRRWYLGALINESHMLCSVKLWKSMPVPLILKVFDYAFCSLTWLFIIYVIGVIKNIVPVWTMAIFFPLLTIKFLILQISASFMKRFKIWLTAPILFLASPSFKLICTIYSICTWNVRSWGGPRADFKTKAVQKLDVLSDVLSAGDQLQLESHRVTQGEQFDPNYEAEAEVDFEEKVESSFSFTFTGRFPSQVDVLGGSEYYTDLIYTDSSLLFPASNSTKPAVSYSPTIATLVNTRNNSTDFHKCFIASKLPYLQNNSSTSLYTKAKEYPNLIKDEYIYGKFQRKAYGLTGKL